MTQFGKSIRIYLKEGTVTGVKFGEIVNHTIQSISCPRLKTYELNEYNEAKRPGVYFLFGQDDETGIPKVYIGEAENVYERLQSHIANKDFWNEVILFISKDENLTKSHVKYLESRLIRIAFKTKRYRIDNSNQSQPSSLPTADKDAMEEFLTHIKLLIGIFGHKFLENITTISTEKEEATPQVETLPNKETKNISDNLELFLSISNLKAKALQTDEGIVVLEGSEASKEIQSSLSYSCIKKREQLIANETLVLEDNKYVFKSNVLFNAASPAAAIIVGYSINGQQTWKDNTGKSLKEIEKDRMKQ